MCVGTGTGLSVILAFFRSVTGYYLNLEPSLSILWRKAELPQTGMTVPHSLVSSTLCLGEEKEDTTKTKARPHKG